MVLHQFCSTFTQARRRDISKSWRVCLLVDPLPLCIWPPPMPPKVFGDAKCRSATNDVLWDYCFVSRSCMLLGFKGAALATSLSSWLNVALLASYAIISPCRKDSWDGFSKKAFCEIRAFLKLAIPSTLMVW
ncbi:Protein transparent TESTA 12 [Apostasia shenzhenica]|uniref:Protein transparent TESTA 12 n=1 Tax=Apostasia shenzhenica TaxID=1088818 RepID=A0A2H9ZVP8_9ASPA|nr:Protein transparent TESTA 12 [Apostasia shenzhenica]